MDIPAFSSVYSTGNGAFMCAAIVFSLLFVGLGILVKMSGGIDFVDFLMYALPFSIVAMFSGLLYSGVVDLPAKFHAHDAYMEEFKETLAEKGFTLADGRLPYKDYEELTIKLEKDGEFSLCEVKDLKDSDILSFECTTLSDPVNLENLVSK